MGGGGGGADATDTGNPPSIAGNGGGGGNGSTGGAIGTGLDNTSSPTMVERERLEMFQVPVVVEEDNQVQIQQQILLIIPILHSVVVVKMEPYIYGLKYILLSHLYLYQDEFLLEFFLFKHVILDLQNVILTKNLYIIVEV